MGWLTSPLLLTQILIMMDKSAAASTVSVTQGQSAKVNVSADISATSGNGLPQATEARAEVSSEKVRDAVSRINVCGTDSSDPQ